MLYRHWQLGSICVPLCPTGYEPARSIIPPNDARKHRLISQVIPAFLLDVGARLARAVVVKAGHRGPMRNGRSRTDMVPADPPGVANQHRSSARNMVHHR